jgi:hypothetical protein
LVGALRALEDDMPKYNEETLLEMIESYWHVDSLCYYKLRNKKENLNE